MKKDDEKNSNSDVFDESNNHEIDTFEEISPLDKFNFDKTDLMNSTPKKKAKNENYYSSEEEDILNTSRDPLFSTKKTQIICENILDQKEKKSVSSYSLDSTECSESDSETINLKDEEEDKKEKGSKSYIFTSLFKQTWKILLLAPDCWKYIPFAIISSILNGGIYPSFIVVLGRFFTNVSQLKGSDLVDATAISSLLFVSIGILALILQTIQGVLWSLIGETISKSLKLRYFEALLYQKIPYFDKIDSSEPLQRLSGDVQLIQIGMSDKAGILIFSFSQAIISFVVGFILSWKLAGVLLAITPLFGCIGGIQFWFVRREQEKTLIRDTQSLKIPKEATNNIKTVYAYSLQSHLFLHFSKFAFKNFKSRVKLGSFSAFSQGSNSLFLFGTYSLGLWWGGVLVEKGEVEIGEILTVFFAIIIGSTGLGTIVNVFPDVLRGLITSKQLFKIIGNPSTNSLGEDNGIIIEPSEFKGKIEFQNVDFEYNSRKGIPVLNSLSFIVESGTSLALVGPSGAGKSSIISLLEKFYLPKSGKILIDGISLNDLNEKWLRSRIGIVFQEPILFSTTIEDNIKSGRDCTFSEIKKAAKAANAHKFIKSLPNQYQTEVGDRGCKLSGGQKQRIAIARAILGNPKIVLLDEATSALDTESEKIVQSALGHLLKGRTSITIAHRLSTITHCHQIAVLSKGKIIEKGSHLELVQKTGPYSILCKNQQL